MESKIKGAVYLFLALLVGACALRSLVRNRDWRSHASLWTVTVKASPESPKAHNNMGDVYSLEGELEKAASEFRQAIELKPDYAEAYHNLATTYLKMGRVDEAILAYQQALKFKPGLYQSHTNLGFIYLKKGQRELARQHFEKAAALTPDNEQIKEFLRQAQ